MLTAAFINLNKFTCIHKVLQISYIGKIAGLGNNIIFTCQYDNILENWDELTFGGKVLSS